MDVTEIPELIQKIWNTIVPPMVEAIISIFIIWILIGNPMLSLNEMIGITSEQLIPSESMREVMTFYGISAVIPIAILLLLFATAQMIGNIVHWVGKHIPLHIVENSTALMVHVADQWMLRKLWVCHPGLDDINGMNTARLLIREAIIKAKTDPNAHHYLKARAFDMEIADRYKNRFIFVKGLLLITLLTWIVTEIFGIENCSIERFAIVILTLSVFSIFLVVKHIDEATTRFKYDFITYIDVMGATMPKGGEPDLSTYDTDIKRIEEIKNAKIGRMWMIRFFQSIDRGDALNQLMGAIKELIWRAKDNSKR